MGEDSASSATKSPQTPHHRRFSKPLACPHDSCSKVFNRPCDLKYFPLFLRSGDLLTQYRKHEKKHTRPYGCELCPRRFYQKRDLDKHSRTHTGGPSWLCAFDGCGKKFTVDDNLVRHIRNMHDMVVKKSSLKPSQPG